MTQDEITELTGYSRKTVGKRIDDARQTVLRLESSLLKVKHDFHA
jgi:hypothetical protein